MRKSDFLKRKVELVADTLSEMFGTPKRKKADPSKTLDVLIATKLSQNTTDRSSYKAFNNLKEKYGSWEKVSDAGESAIRQCIKVCGLANTKARDIRNMLREMRRRYGSLDLSRLSKMTDEDVYTELLSFKGIGVKTASCVLVFALGRDICPVDTHVHRTLNRLGIVKSNTPDRTFEQASSLIPAGRKYEFHTNLIKFGRNICRAVKPLCFRCPFFEMCTYPDKEKRLNPKATIAVENNFLILEEI